MSISIIALTQQGIETALKIKAVIGGQVCGLSPRTKGADTSFQNATDFIGKQFASGDTIVGICASGILVRAIGAYVGSKKTDSPVIAVSEKGDTVVPLLGGHYGGNDIAGKIANLFNATPSITSAGDITLGFSFDNLPVGWTVSNTDLIKPITAQLLDDGDVRLLNDCSVIFPNTNVFKGDKFTVHITDKSGFENDTTLVIYPPILNIGVGLERKCDGQGFIEFIESVLNKHGFAHQAISSFASIDIKVDEPAIKALSTHFNKPIRFFTAEQLNAQKSNLKNPSDIVFKETGCYGVAEGACLTLGGTLSIEKEKSTKHTMAISKLTTPSLPNNGRKCGKLNVVGIGAGERQWRTPQANRALLESDIFVGYKLYLDMIGDVIGNKPTADSQLGQEEARARKAIELASTGQTVSLVCSGDASIYALATLVFEILDRNPDNRAWQGINIECCPGISAFQAGSSRLGAPFNHDFLFGKSIGFINTKGGNFTTP